MERKSILWKEITIPTLGGTRAPIQCVTIQLIGTPKAENHSENDSSKVAEQPVEQTQLPKEEPVVESVETPETSASESSESEPAINDGIVDTQPQSDGDIESICVEETQNVEPSQTAVEETPNETQ